jgi:hypothetical protein
MGATHRLRSCAPAPVELMGGFGMAHDPMKLAGEIAQRAESGANKKTQ